MPKCPFAIWKPITGATGAFTNSVTKIVHHTTEGSKATGAMDAFKRNKSDPHFTVDGTTIYQHIDTSEAARALKNAEGGGQTNRSAAIQIELVGFAGKDKAKSSLKNLARLCRWLEATHNIPRVWPNGPPKTHNNGKDPNGHNRNATNWDTKGGHYGHSNVPENTHWDHAYTTIEFNYINAATFDASGKLTNPDHPAVLALAARPVVGFGISAHTFDVMSDHNDIGEPD